MSISIGLFDLFSYTIPGMIYLFVINEFMHLLKLPYIDIKELSSITHVILIAVIAYTLGILLDNIAYLIFRIIYKKNKREQALKYFNSRHKDIKHNLAANEASLYLNAIRYKNPQVEEKFTRTMAQSIMLRNISMSFFMLAMLYVFHFILGGFFLQNLLVVIISLVFSIIAIQKSKTFNIWYYNDIYEFVLNYGTDLTEIYPFAKRVEPLKESSQVNQEGSENKQ